MTTVNRNAEESKQRILKAARQIFATKGLDGARVDDIAALAQINKRMIYHYFQNKEGLYLEVLRQYCQKILQDGERGLELKGSPVDKAAQVIRHYFYFLAENPDFVQLVNWETLHDGRFSRQILPEIFQATLPRLEGVLKEGVKQGLFRKDLDIRHLTISIAAMCMVYFYRRDAYNSLWEKDLMHPEMLEERLQHILDFTFNGIINHHHEANNC